MDVWQFLADLFTLDVPVWVATPSTSGREVDRPRNWAELDRAGNAERFQAWRPGMALSGNMGGRLVVLDGDTRNGCDIAAVERMLQGIGVTTYATIATPSGGRHWYLAGHPDLPTVHATADRDGFTSHPGLELISHGANVFLPGTSRPKYGGRGYAILENRLAELIDRHDDESAINLADWVANHRKTRPETFTASTPWDGTPPDRRQQAYLDGLVHNHCARLAAMQPDTGRNVALFNSAMAMGNFIAGAGLDEDKAVAALIEAARACGLVQDSGINGVIASIKSGLRNGKQAPREVPEPESPFTVDNRVLTKTPDMPSQAPVSPPGDTQGPPGPQDTEGGEERATWAPVDLTAYLDGTHQSVEPSLFTRTDGVSLMYPGLTHSFHGESESGKSMLLQIETALLINDGMNVLFIDFESDPAAITERLTMFGATHQSIKEHFTYIRPEIDPRTMETELTAWHQMLNKQYALAVIDGVTDSLGVFGYSTKDNDDITAWMRIMPKNIAKTTGAAVAVIDHVTKDSDTRGRFAIGGQAKMSALTGAGYTVEIKEPLGRGLRGEIEVRVGKDRPGYVRGHSGPMRTSDRTQSAARVIVDSTGTHPVVTVAPPETGEQATTFRYTGYMEGISRELQEHPDGLTYTKLYKNVPGTRDRIDAALAQLVTEGFVTMTPGARNAHVYRSAKPYTQTDDPKSDRHTPPVDNPLWDAKNSQNVADTVSTPNRASDSVHRVSVSIHPDTVTRSASVSGDTVLTRSDTVTRSDPKPVDNPVASDPRATNVDHLGRPTRLINMAGGTHTMVIATGEVLD